MRMPVSRERRTMRATRALRTMRAAQSARDSRAAPGLAAQRAPSVSVAVHSAWPILRARRRPRVRAPARPRGRVHASTMCVHVRVSAHACMCRHALGHAGSASGL